VRLSARRENGAVMLRVFDDGARLGEVPADGTGLATTRQRLATRFGERATLTVRPVDGGVEALVRIEDTR